MATSVEPFRIGTNNLVEIVLTEGGSPVPNLQLATQLDITVGGLLISRTTSENGVDFSQGGGLVIINPGQLVEDVSTLPQGDFVPGQIRVFDPTNTEGVVFGGADSDPRLMFSIL